MDIQDMRACWNAAKENLVEKKNLAAMEWKIANKDGLRDTVEIKAGMYLAFASSYAAAYSAAVGSRAGFAVSALGIAASTCLISASQRRLSQAAENAPTP